MTTNANLCTPTTKSVTVRRRVAVRRHGRTVHMLRAVTQHVTEPLLMPTTIVGQNGAVIEQNTKIDVTGCPNAKTKTRVKHDGGKGKKK